MQQLNEYLNELVISRGASGAGDSGLPDDEMIDSAGYETEVNITTDEMILDAKKAAERYVESGGPYSYEGFDHYVLNYLASDLHRPFLGTYYVHGMFTSGPVEYENDEQKEFCSYYWYFLYNYTGDYVSDWHSISNEYHNYTPKTRFKQDYEHCTRCGEDVAPMEFFDRGMCADCNEEVYGVIIDNCVVCCDVN